MLVTIPKREGVSLTDKTVLPKACVHEIMGRARDGFAIMLATKLSGPIVWIGGRRDVESLAPTALKAFIDPTRIILTEGTTRQEILWAGEQALRSKGAAMVVLQLKLGPDLKESRRLQLAAEEGDCIGLVLIERSAQSSAAQTRWLCEARPTNDLSWERRWLWELTKNKSGPLGKWLVEWKEESHAASYVHMAAYAAA